MCDAVRVRVKRERAGRVGQKGWWAGAKILARVLSPGRDASNLSTKKFDKQRQYQFRVLECAYACAMFVFERWWLQMRALNVIAIIRVIMNYA